VHSRPQDHDIFNDKCGVPQLVYEKSSFDGVGHQVYRYFDSYTLERFLCRRRFDGPTSVDLDTR